MDWKRIGRKLLFPPVWLLVILTLFSAAALTAVFIKGWEQSAIAYMVYVLAFYTLSVVSVFCCRVLPEQLGQIRQNFRSTSLGSRYTQDPAFRMRSSLNLSLCINLLYMVINLLSWIWNRSWWFMVLAGYYVIMALLWFLLVRYVRKEGPAANSCGAWKRARLCACILLTVNLSLSGAVLMILYQSKGYNYPGIMIYVMAMYTFYSTIHAIIDIIKNQKTSTPIRCAAQVISLSAALVSLLNLETAMFAQFGADLSPENQRIFIILTGAGVSIAVVTMSVILIVKATQEIRREMHGE